MLCVPTCLWSLFHEILEETISLCLNSQMILSRSNLVRLRRRHQSFHVISVSINNINLSLIDVQRIRESVGLHTIGTLHFRSFVRAVSTPFDSQLWFLKDFTLSEAPRVLRVLECF